MITVGVVVSRCGADGKGRVQLTPGCGSEGGGFMGRSGVALASLEGAETLSEGAVFPSL